MKANLEDWNEFWRNLEGGFCILAYIKLSYKRTRNIYIYIYIYRVEFKLHLV